MQDFFNSYAQGYVDQDMARIAAHFSYPCMLTNQSGTDLICDADDLEQHITGQLALMKNQGLSRAAAHIDHDMLHGTDNRVVSVSWSLQGTGGEMFAEYAFLYVLVRSADGWKISLANPI